MPKDTKQRAGITDTSCIYGHGLYSYGLCSYGLYLNGLSIALARQMPRDAKQRGDIDRMKHILTVHCKRGSI